MMRCGKSLVLYLLQKNVFKLSSKPENLKYFRLSKLKQVSAHSFFLKFFQSFEMS